MKKLGLGNPGDEYEQTRHNVGFFVIDEIAKKLDLKLNVNKFNGVFVVADDFIIAKPLTYMNLSGKFVKQIVDYYKIKHDDIMVIQDDLDTEVGLAKIKTVGGSGGHNGIKSIIESLQDNKFNRLKIGIGRPSRSSQQSISSYVLGRFNEKEKNLIDAVVIESANAIISWIDNGLKNIINKFNQSK